MRMETTIIALHLNMRTEIFPSSTRVWCVRMLRSHAISFELAAQLELKPYNFVCITGNSTVAVVVAMASHRVNSQLLRAHTHLLCFVVAVSFAVVSIRATLSLPSVRKMHKSCSEYEVSIVHISIIFVGIRAAVHQMHTRKD